MNLIIRSIGALLLVGGMLSAATYGPSAFSISTCGAVLYVGGEVVTLLEKILERLTKM